MKILSTQEVKNIFRFAKTVRKPISLLKGKQVKHTVDNYDIKFEVGRVHSERGLSALVVPFRMILRGTQNRVEEKCAEKYPQLMDYSELMIDDLHQLRKMQAMIHSELTYSDICGFVYELVRSKFLSPFTTMDNFLKFIHVNIDEVNCKVFYEQRIPHLIIDADYVIDLKGYFDAIDAKKMIKFTFNRSFTHLEIKARLLKPLLIVGRKINITKLKAEIERALTDRLYDKSSTIRSEAIKWSGGNQEDFERSSLSSKWNGDNEILFVFDKLYSGFIEKLWKNKYKIAAAALVISSIKKDKK